MLIWKTSDDIDNNLVHLGHMVTEAEVDITEHVDEVICDVPGCDKILSKLSTINAQKHINSCLDKHNKKLVAAKTEESKRKKAKKYLMGYFNKKQKTCDRNIESTSTCNDALKKIASETMTI